MDAEKMSALDVILEKESCEGTYCGAPVHPYQTFEDARAELSALRAENARMREALTEIASGAPTEEPDRIETDNRDDCYTNGYERAEWAAAKIARAALGGRDEGS